MKVLIKHKQTVPLTHQHKQWPLCFNPLSWSGLHISLVVCDWSNKSHVGTISPIICGRQWFVLPCTQSISYMLLVSCLRRHVTCFSCTYDTWIRREDTGISVGYFVIFLLGCIVRPNQYQAEKRSLNMDTSDSDLSYRVVPVHKVA